MSRQAGFYWVKCRPWRAGETARWELAEYSGEPTRDCWLLLETTARDRVDEGDISEVGPRIEPPA